MHRPLHSHECKKFISSKFWWKVAYNAIAFGCNLQLHAVHLQHVGKIYLTAIQVSEMGSSLCSRMHAADPDLNGLASQNLTIPLKMSPW